MFIAYKSDKHLIQSALSTKTKVETMRIISKTILSVISKISVLQFILIGTVSANICDKDQDVAKILSQTSIVNFEQSLMDCKLDPLDHSKVIMAFAQWIPVKDEPEQGAYYLNLLKFNQADLKVFYNYVVRGEIVSDAISLESIQLDTANYNITRSNRALGVRLNYSGHSQPNPFSMQVLNLYDLKNKKKILDSLIVERYRAETDTRCNAAVEERSSTLMMQGNKTKNYSDIRVNSKIKSYEMVGTRGDCKEINQRLSQQSFVLKFDGQEYQLHKKYKDDYQY